MTTDGSRFITLHIGVMLLLWTHARPSEGADRLQPEHVARVRAVTSVAAAPDGSKVAYVLGVPRRPLVDEDGPAWTELHVVTPDGQSRPFITGEVNVSEVTWTPDGKLIAFLAKRGKDEFKSLYLIDPNGGEARRVLTHKADITGFSFAPDSTRVAFLAVDPEPKARQDLKKKGFNQIVFEEDQPSVKVWVGSIAEGAAEPKVLPLAGSASDLHWSPAGADRLALALAPTPGVDDGFTRRKVHVIAADSGQILAKYDNPGKLGKIAWRPDGLELGYLSAADEHDPAVGRLMLAPAEGGLPREHPKFPDGHCLDFAWGDRENLAFLVDMGTETIVNTVQKGLPHGQTPNGVVFTAVSPSNDGQTLALVGQSAGHPPEVFLRRGETATRLTRSNPWLDGIELAKQEVVKFKARDGLDLEGILIRPMGVPEGTRVPLILDVHGGPESHVRNGWITGYSTPGQILAARGFAVFAPNYRGSTGRGVAFSKLGQGDPAGKEFDDLVDAVDHLVAIGVADKAKVGITGGSYGGYATGWCSTRYSDRFAAGVMFVGISDKVSKTGTTDIPEEEFLVHALRRPWDDWNLLRERSPIAHTETAKTPLLILHGKEDPRVFPGQSLELYRFLKVRNQAPVRLVLYPGEGHGNVRAASRLDYNLRMIQWFEHYLKGPGGPPPPPQVDVEGKQPAAAKS